MKLSLSFEFALRLLGGLGPYEVPHKSRDLSMRLGIPYNHLIKIVHRLSKEQIITTRKGKNGGVVLPKASLNYDLHDVYQLFEPVTHVSDCLCDESPPTCHLYSGCTILPIYADIQSSIEAILCKNKIRDLMKKEAR